MSTRRTVRGNSAISVQVRGVDGIRRALRPLLEPELTAHLDAANKKGAQTYAKALRVGVRPLSRRMAKAVRVRRAKTGKPGWIIGSRRTVAFWWPFVIGGTKDHGPRKADALVFTVGNRVVRTKRVRGVPAHPVVEQVARANETKVAAQIDRDFTKATGL